MDRTQEDEAKKPLHKLFVIQNFGIYYKPNDVMFISELSSEQTRLEQLNYLFPAGREKILQYADSYLLEPVKLNTKLTLGRVEQWAQVSLDIENLDVCMQKT